MTIPLRRPVVVVAFVAVLWLAVIGGLAFLDLGQGSGSGGHVGGEPPGRVSNTFAAGSTTSKEDELAARPMLSLPSSAAQPQPLTTATAGPPIVVPPPAVAAVPNGPPVASGFPHTPEGALGQLAAIDEGALSTADLGRVHEVYAWAAAPGAGSEHDWQPSVAVSSLIDGLGGRERAMQAIAVFQVTQGQIKGTVGSDFVLACVLGEVDVTLNTTVRGAGGDCQRMVWREQRWWIGSGTQPAFPPSAWPGSADAVRGGWREIKRA